MLLGTSKGVRLSAEGLVVPPQLREGLEDPFVMTRGLDRCVAVFPLTVWDAMLERIDPPASFLRGAARLFQRHIYGGALVDTLGPDGQMNVPEHLRRYAELGNEVVVVGVATRLEIWSPERWSEEELNIIERAEQVSEALSGHGI